ncbi:MAG: hypothetical protein OXK73_13045 [Rhodospirillaceae bacterium]|nr:hypothetical protein [Rhodospirillaceae bacterium]
MAEKGNLESIVEAVLKEVFGAARIEDVYVVHTVDADGDDILRIYVAFNGTEDQFNAKAASGVVRQMRPRLSEELQEDAFPIISYLSSADVKAVRNAVG